MTSVAPKYLDGQSFKVLLSIIEAEGIKSGVQCFREAELSSRFSEELTTYVETRGAESKTTLSTKISNSLLISTILHRQCIILQLIH